MGILGYSRSLMRRRVSAPMANFVRWRRIRFVEFVVSGFPGTPTWSRIKYWLLRSLGAQLEWPVHIDRLVWIASPEKLTAGPGLVLARGTVFTCAGGVTVGKGCLFGYYSFVCSANHKVPASTKEAIYRGGHDLEAVHIGDDCWVGAHAIVLPGVSMAAGSVIGAGTVVSKSLSEATVLVGAAGRPVRFRNDG